MIEATATDWCESSATTILTNANLSGADARGANFYFATLDGANTSNLIQSDGHIAGLDLTAGASLVVRDYDGNPAASPPTGPLPIVVDQHLAMDATGTLRLVFDADPWDSTISFAPGIPVALGGTLELDLRARRRRRHPKRPDDRPLRLDRRDAHRRVHRFQPLHLEPHQSLHHRRSHPHRRAEFARRLQPRRHRRRRRLRRLAQNPAASTRQNDFNIWRANFGQTAGSGSGASANATVPEPATLVMLIVTAAGVSTRRRWRTWRVSKLNNA